MSSGYATTRVIGFPTGPSSDWFTNAAIGPFSYFRFQ